MTDLIEFGISESLITLNIRLRLCSTFNRTFYRTDSQDNSTWRKWHRVPNHRIKDAACIMLSGEICRINARGPNFDVLFPTRQMSTRTMDPGEMYILKFSPVNLISLSFLAHSRNSRDAIRRRRRHRPAEEKPAGMSSSARR